MPLIKCPECAHDVSTSADACPNCGHPLAASAVRSRIVSELPAERSSIPPWIFVPIGVLAVLLLFVFIFFIRNDDSANRNIDVNVNAQRGSSDRRDSDLRPDNPPNDIVVPPSSTTDTTVLPGPQTSDIDRKPTEFGNVSIEARVADKSGSTKPVKDEKFYLLDKQLENILREADIKSIDGQTLINTFGLSVLSPEKYGDTNKRALAAIEDHVKYSALSDLTGKAQLKDVEPGSYYLFAITKTTNGFAVWSSPVTIKAGENRLVLPPGRVTEVNQ